MPQPEAWNVTAQVFYDAMNGNASVLLEHIGGSDVGIDVTRSSISCNDQKRFAPPTPQAVIDEGLRATQDTSRFYFAVLVNEPDSGCQYWPFTPPEQYLGPWNKTLKNPILIISNTVSLSCESFP